MLYDVHRLALAYHWSEPEILRLSLSRRAAYLALVGEDGERSLFDALEEG